MCDRENRPEDDFKKAKKKGSSYGSEKTLDHKLPDC